MDSHPDSLPRQSQWTGSRRKGDGPPERGRPAGKGAGIARRRPVWNRTVPSPGQAGGKRGLQE
nr:uncharacterized protein [uncultured bacterium]